MSNFTEVQIDRWRLFWDEANENKDWLARHRERDTRRIEVQQELLHLLNQFLSKEISVEKMKNIFDRRTRTDWNVFGLKGTSGAMFLNKMVKHIPDSAELTGHLSQALRVPAGETEGQRQMCQFYDYLTSLIALGVQKGHLSPGYTPFFLSAWWHFQDTQQWPVFYVSGRNALKQESGYTEGSNPVDNYFAFRKHFLDLASTLNLKSWQLEHLFTWYVEERSSISKPDKQPPVVPRIIVEENSEIEVEDSIYSHTQIQWMLAKLGRKLGCRVWIATNDQNKQWNGERLGELSLKSLPSLGLDKISRQIISLIDVLWIKGFNQVVAAFEVEHTTSIYSGLLRLSDLTATSPNLSFPLYIVTPEKRLDKVRRELSRPTFQILELHKQCGFFSFEVLMREADYIMKWATDPATIERLAAKVDDVTYEDEG
jgi:hypothetical protein